MPLPLAAIPLAVSAIQGVAGAVQTAKGKKKLKNTVRPEYAVPAEIEKNVAKAEQLATTGLDASSKQIATQQMDRNIAASLYGAGARKAGITGLGNVVQAGNDAALNLASADAMEKARKENNASIARSELASYKDKAFAYNKDEPYKLQLEDAQAMSGAGLQNIAGALNTAATTGLYGMSGSEGSAGGGGNKAMSPEDKILQDQMKGMTPSEKTMWLQMTPEERKRFLNKRNAGF